MQKISSILTAILIEYRRVTDTGQTQTYTRAQGHTCASIVSFV